MRNFIQLPPASYEIYFKSLTKTIKTLSDILRVMGFFNVQNMAVLERYSRMMKLT